MPEVLPSGLAQSSQPLRKQAPPVGSSIPTGPHVISGVAKASQVSSREKQALGLFEDLRAGNNKRPAFQGAVSNRTAYLRPTPTSLSKILSFPGQK